MLIQAYVTASILSRQVDVDLTKDHSPGCLRDRMLVYFPAQFMYWYKRCLENKREEIFRGDLQEEEARDALFRNNGVSCVWLFLVPWYQSS